MTAPQIGNYGVNTEDPESAATADGGCDSARAVAITYSNWRSDRGPPQSGRGRVGPDRSASVDTRRLTRHLRVRRGDARSYWRRERASREAVAALGACPQHGGTRPGARSCRRRSPTAGAGPDAPHHVVAYDYGIKRKSCGCFAEPWLPGDGRAVRHLGGRSDGAGPGRGLPFQRSGRSGGGDLCAGDHPGDRGDAHAGVRHLPWAISCSGSASADGPRRCPMATGAGISR